jgi:hypothetical protein
MISYFSRAWRTGARYDEKHHGVELDPQPPKPLWRPGWWVQFLDGSGKKLVGKVWQAQRPKTEPDDGPTTYTVKVEDDGYFVTEERIIKRVKDR